MDTLCCGTVFIEDSPEHPLFVFVALTGDLLDPFVQLLVLHVEPMLEGPELMQLPTPVGVVQDVAQFFSLLGLDDLGDSLFGSIACNKDDIPHGMPSLCC